MSDLYCELSERDSQYEEVAEVAEEVAFADGTRPKIWTRFRKLKLNWIFVCEWMWEWLFFSSLTGGFFCMRPVSFFSSKKSRFFFNVRMRVWDPCVFFFPHIYVGFFLINDLNVTMSYYFLTYKGSWKNSQAEYKARKSCPHVFKKDALIKFVYFYDAVIISVIWKVEHV